MTLARMRKIVWRRMTAAGYSDDLGLYIDVLRGDTRLRPKSLELLFHRALRRTRPRTKHGWISRCRACDDQFRSRTEKMIAEMER